MTRVKQTTFAIFLGLSFLLFLAGCSEEKNGAIIAPQEDNDEAALTQMMLEDEDIETLNAWQGEDDQELETASLDEIVDPVRWGRIGRRHLVDVTTEIQGDTFATITRTFTFNGFFRLVTDTTGGTRTIVDKSMHNVIVRKAHAVRVRRSDRPRMNWRITEVTPDVMTSTAPEPNTIWPVSARFYRANGDSLELVADITDPLNTYYSRLELPTVYAGEELIVRVQANSTDNAVAVLHPRAHFRIPRLYLHDDGIAPDETAGDGVWSGSYLVHRRGGVFLAGIDLLDWGTVFDTEAPYDATGWAIPYRVVRPR